MDMSAAALPPRQPLITDADRAHPRFPEYARYRAGMSNKLLECESFGDWRVQQERHARDDEWERHPQFRAFQTWMVAEQGGARRCPAGSFPENFKFWLSGGRW